MILLLGDIHGMYEKLINLTDSFARENQADSYRVVLLGDSGMNFYLDERDRRIKGLLQEAIDQVKKKRICVDIFFVRGNHECRPEDIETYRSVNTAYGELLVEEQFPNLLFFKDGFTYEIEGKHILVIGGGNSSDFFSRMLNGEPFWESESYSLNEEQKILDSVSKICEKELIVFSHVLPKELAIEKKEGIAGRSVEELMSRIWSCSPSRILKWYAGHYHMDRKIDYGETVFYIVYNEVIGLE